MRHLHSILVLAACTLAGAASAQTIRTTVDGALVDFPDMQPTMINSRVMVPVRGVFEHMNATVRWDQASQTVFATKGNDDIRLPVNSMNALVNGESVRLDTPAVVRGGRTLVPLRFLAGALGANVEWMASTRTVEIDTVAANVVTPPRDGLSSATMDAGTVIPFRLNQELSSDGSSVGDKFTARLDTNGSPDYQGLVTGSVLEGHVDVARAKSGETPGVLGLAFDRVRMPDGKAYKVYGSLIGLDSNSVSNENGRLVAKPAAKNDNLKWVGIGAGGGALIAILTKNNVITTTLIGGALGLLYGELKKDNSKAKDVTSAPGTKFGVRLAQDLAFQTTAN